MTTDLTLHQSTAPAPYADPLADRMRAQMDLIKAQIMPPRVDAQGKVLGPATDDETALAIAQAAARGVDLLANQGRLVRNKQGVVELWRTWEGLVVVAQRTGEWGGVEATLYTDGRKQAATNQWGKIVEQYVWQDAWDSDEPPVACTVGIWRKGAARPSWGIAHYSTWGTEPDPDGWSDKLDANGKPVRRKKRNGEWYTVRVHNGKRVPKASEWWQMPGCIHQLAIAALRNALKAEFQPDVLRKATMAAAGKLGLDRDERLELASEIVGHNVESFNDLDPTEYAEVYDDLVGRAPMDTTVVDVEDTIAPAEHPASGAQAGPLSPKAAGPADSSAGDESGHYDPSMDPAEPPSDKGRNPDSELAGQGEAVAEARRDVPAAREAASPARSKRKAPNLSTGATVAKAQQTAQEFRDSRREQTDTHREPTDPLHWLPPEDRTKLLAFVYGRDDAEKQDVARRLLTNTAMRGGWHGAPTDNQLKAFRLMTYEQEKAQ